MGEIISKNILLPLMYFLVDVGLTFGIIVLFLMTIERILDSTLIKSITRKIK